MNNSHIIAKLVSSQVQQHLTSDTEAIVIFQVKPPKKWQRGRFEEVIFTITQTNTAERPGVSPGTLVDVHVQHRGIDGDVLNRTWYVAETRGGYERLFKVLSGKMVFDTRSPGVVIRPRTNEPAT